MSTIQLTPASLIKLMEDSRQLPYTDMMRVLDSIRQYQGVITPEDMTNIFNEVAQAHEDVFAPANPNIQAQLKQILLQFINSNDLDLTDQEISNMYNWMQSITSPKGPINADFLVNRLRRYVSNRHTDISDFDRAELDQMLEGAEIDEGGSQILLQREPELPPTSTRVLRGPQTK